MHTVETNETGMNVLSPVKVWWFFEDALLKTGMNRIDINP